MIAFLRKALQATALALVLVAVGGPAQAADVHFDELHRNDSSADTRNFHLDNKRMTASFSFTCNNGSVTVSLYHHYNWRPDVKAGGSTTVPCDDRANKLEWDVIEGGDYHFHFEPVSAAGANPLHVVGDVRQP
ncbi:hypothetical protein [Streptomyces sp. NPDC001404]|uniref:hypothetical protein n=1 Tax=Streptomyces sp. NPDC001404 TaxID=3364571 RepID=UPI003690E4EE